jgi:hypothetical protein
MKKFILLYKGPPTSPNASHEGWPEWFSKIGRNLVDKGSAMFDGFDVYADRSTSKPNEFFNGYSIMQAQNREKVISMLTDHPYLSLGADYVVEVYELPI